MLKALVRENWGIQNCTCRNYCPYFFCFNHLLWGPFFLRGLGTLWSLNLSKKMLFFLEIGGYFLKWVFAGGGFTHIQHSIPTIALGSLNVLFTTHKKVIILSALGSLTTQYSIPLSLGLTHVSHVLTEFYF